MSASDSDTRIQQRFLNACVRRVTAPELDRLLIDVRVEHRLHRDAGELAAIAKDISVADADPRTVHSEYNAVQVALSVLRGSA